MAPAPVLTAFPSPLHLTMALLRTVTVWTILAVSALISAPTARAAEPTTLDALLNTPLVSNDPTKPIQVIAQNWWAVTDKVSPEMAKRIEGRRQLKVGMDVPIATFTFDAAKGPVTVVVDYAGLPKAWGTARGRVSLSLECMDKPMACAQPVTALVMGFQGSLMPQVPIKVGDAKFLIAVGREAKTYRLPPGETVRINLKLEAQQDMEPLMLKAAVIYGENAAETVMGQTAKRTAIGWWIGAGVLLLGFALYRLNRR